MAYCRVESIDPETRELVYLRKRKSDHKTQNNHRGLLEALERASTMRQKSTHAPAVSENQSSETSEDNLLN